MKRNTRSTAGTTLVEVLVVIVVFLVGILAIVQIFPRGFRILELNRRGSVAAALAREAVEKIKSNPEQLPEAVLAVTYDATGVAQPRPDRDPYDLGPLGDSVRQNGNLYQGATLVGTDWTRFSGSNAMRRIVGETRQVPAPSLVGGSPLYYGGLLVLNYGPIDPDNGFANGAAALRVYGPDLTRKAGTPSALDLQDDSSYAVDNENTTGASVWLPTGPQARLYLVSFSAFTSVGGVVARRDYTYLTPISTVATAVNPATGTYPPSPTVLGTMLPATDVLQSVVVSSIRVQRSFNRVAKNAPFAVGDAYQYKLLSEYLGSILIAPEAHSVTIVRSNGVREPLQVRFNYDVYDWRILKEDFRPSSSVPYTYQLAVRGLKVATEVGPDGRGNGPLPFEGTPPAGYTDISPANAYLSDNFILVDLATGGVVSESVIGSPASRLIVVDKSLGTVTFSTQNAGMAGLRGQLLLADGTVLDNVPFEGRALRALYRAKSEYAVQLLKAPSQFSTTQDAANIFYDQYYVGGSGPVGGALTRIYFSRSNNGRKVNLGQLNYTRVGGGPVQNLVAQDFLLGYPRDNDPTGLPCLDIRDVDPAAMQFDWTSGSAVRDVKGASVAIRVLWNPETFNITANASANLQLVEQWGRNWRRNTNETFIQRGEIVR